MHTMSFDLINTPVRLQDEELQFQYLYMLSLGSL